VPPAPPPSRSAAAAPAALYRTMLPIPEPDYTHETELDAEGHAAAPLLGRPEATKDWSAPRADEKRLFTGQMEIFAGFGEYPDTEVGRLVDAIRDVGQLDNTLVFYILGDNGTSVGGMSGIFNESTQFNGVQESVVGMAEALRRPGGADVVPAHGRGLGGGRRHAAHVDEAGGVELRRHPQRPGRVLAEAGQGDGRGALAVPSRHRRGAHGAGGRRPARAEDRQGHAPGADRAGEHGSRWGRWGPA
jgi:arylsulfatase A-like enzyme